MGWPSLRAVNRKRFEQIVDEALDSLPEWVVEQVDNLHVVVEDWPTREQDPDGERLLGIYEGVSLADRGVDYYGFAPDRIVIFRGPHAELGLSTDVLRDEIRRTVLHEVAHHLGIDDDRLHQLGWD
jgi:predicted Zn-dependent protease with MMP-like domain